MAEKPTYKELERRVQELEKAEFGRKFAEDRLKKIFDNTQDAIFIHDIEGKILDVNDKMCRIYGLTTKEEALELTIKDVSSSRMSMNVLLERWQKVLNGEELLFEWEAFRPKDNTVFNVEVSIQKISFHDKDIVLANVRDITERKRMEEALRESLQRLEFALQGGDLGIWDWNPQDGAVLYSDLWAQILEYRPEEVEPTMEFFKQHVHPEDLAAVLDRLTGHVEGRLPVYESEHRFRTKSGKWLWVQDRGKIAERDKDGRPVRVTGLIADITERKEAEEALRERIKEMNAFYHLSSLVEKPTIVLDELYQEMANVLPQSWQYPEEACARIVISGREFRSSNFAESRWHQTEIIRVNGSDVGRIDVGYIEEKPEQDEGPFLKEERMLLHAIAERIGHITESKRAKEALQKSEERFSLAMEASRDGIWDWDLTTGEIYCSPGLTSMLGYDSNDVIKNVGEWKNLIHPEDRQKAYQANMDCVNNRTGSFEHEYRMMTKEGGLKWILGRGKAVYRDDSGRALRMIGTHHDITDRKEAEMQLQKSEEQFRNLYDDAPVGYFEYDLQGNITRVNRTHSKMLGYTPEEMIGQPCWKFIVDEVAREQILDKLRGVRPPGVGLERTYRRKDGTTFPVLFEDRLLTDEDGRIKGIRTAIQDITDRKRAEAALKKSEEKYRTLFESSKDPVYISTIEGTVIDANPSFFALFCYTRDDLDQLKTQDLYVNPDNRAEFIKELNESGFVKDYLEKLRTKDGYEMDCLITATVRRSVDGEITGYQGTIRDITEVRRKQLEKEQLISDLQDALAEVKKLSGLLPICMHCKKIRDDKGYWNQLEAYIHEHSDAEFSHSICRDCAEKYYPDMNIYDD